MKTEGQSRFIPLGAALVFLGADLFLLPAGPRHMAYVLSAETGIWAPVEFAHPLFVPVLSLLHGLGGLLGWTGGVLLPAQLLGAAAGAAAVGLLCRAALRLSGDRWAALACAAAFGLSKGFWLQHVRPMPYALAALLAIGALSVLQEGRPGRRRAAAAGVLGGAASGMTIACLALLPPMLWAARRDAAEGRRGGEAFVLAASFGGTLFAAFALFFTLHGIDPASLHPAALFRQVEQVAGSSLWSSGSLWTQLAAMGRALSRELGPGLLAVCALAALPGLKRLGDEGGAARHAVLWWGSAASFCLFFLINNTQNGFIFICALFLPWAAASFRSRKVFSTGLACCAALMAARIGVEGAGGRLLYPGWTDEAEPAYREAGFVSGFLRPGDLLLVPDPPAPELFYFFREHPAVLDSRRLGRRTTDRIRRAAVRGARIYWAQRRPGGEEEDEAGLFRPDARSRHLDERLSRFEAFLRKDFRLGSGLRSPNGTVYRPVAVPRLRNQPPRPSGLPGWDEDWPAPTPGFRAFRASIEAVPEEPERYCALADAYWEAGLRRAASEALGAAGGSPCAREERGRFYSSLRKDAGILRFRAGRPREALRELDAAVSADPLSDEALLSRAAVRESLGDAHGAASDLERVVAFGPGGSALYRQAVGGLSRLDGARR